MKKKLIQVFVLLCLILPLTGCKNEWIRIVNLQKRAIVQGVGIDWDGENFIVTMQVFSPDGSGGQTMIDASKHNAKVLTCTGKTVAEAIESSSRDQGKRFYLGHNRIVILGQEVLHIPLRPLLSYFVNSLDSRPDVNLLITKGKASDILSAEITQSILPSMSIEQTIQNAEHSGYTEEILLIDVLQDLSQPHRGTIIPFIEAVNTESDEDKELRLVRVGGMGVFSGEKYVGELSDAEVRGLLTLRDTLHGAVYTLHTPTYQRAAVQLYDGNTHIITEFHGKQPTFRVEVRGKWTLLEKDLRPDCKFSVDSLQELEKALSDQISSECMQAFQKTVEEYHQDVCFLGDLLWHEQPEVWNFLQEEWPSDLEKSAIKIHVSTAINRTGLQEIQWK